MKRTRILILLLAVVALIVAGTAEAGLFGKDKNKARDTAQAKTWRYRNTPDMDFHKGVIESDGFHGWMLGDTRIHLSGKCEIISDEDGRNKLEGGRKAIVMGPRVGDTIVAWQIRILQPDHAQGVRASGENVVWSDVDRTVGEGTGPE